MQKMLEKQAEYIGNAKLSNDSYVTPNKKQTEMFFKEHEEQYRYWLEALPEALIVHQQWEMVYMNPAGARLLGVEHTRELIGHSFLESIHPADRASVHQWLLEVQEEAGQPVLTDIRFPRPDGQSKYAEVTAIQVNYKGKPAVLSVIRDVTKRKLTEESDVIERKRELAEELSNADRLSIVSELAAGVAHEIRNPLTSLKGFLQLAREGKYEPKYMDIIVSELEHIERIVDQLLAMSKRT